MTIIKPHARDGIMKFIGALTIAILFGGVVYIYEYNTFVESRHERDELKKMIVEAKVENAELKSKFYTATDPSRLESFAKENNLVSEKQPEYLSYQWLSDSSF